MRYVLARADDIARERAYRIYVTDILKGAFLDKSSKRYGDMFKREVEDNRKPEDVISNIRAKLGG